MCISAPDAQPTRENEQAMPRRGKTSADRPRVNSDPSTRRAAVPLRRAALRSNLRDAVASLDAEDIALARLQAHLRRAETIHVSARPAASGLRRTTVRIPTALLDRLRERARRDGMTASEVVERALERFLRLR